MTVIVKTSQPVTMQVIQDKLKDVKEAIVGVSKENPLLYKHLKNKVDNLEYVIAAYAKQYANGGAAMMEGCTQYSQTDALADAVAAAKAKTKE